MGLRLRPDPVTKGQTLNVDEIRRALGAAPFYHADTSTQYGVATTELYGHVRAASAAPPSIGDRNYVGKSMRYAREDHEHKLPTGAIIQGKVENSSNADTATKVTNPIQNVTGGSYSIDITHWNKVINVTSSCSLTIGPINAAGYNVTIKNNYIDNITIVPAECTIDGTTSPIYMSPKTAVILYGNGANSTNFISLNTAAILQ